MKGTLRLMVFVMISHINFGLIAQDVDIDGKLTVADVTEDLLSTEIVIYQSDGTFAKRAISSLLPTSSSPTHYVGELMGAGGEDGIVFWVDHTGEHGLIRSPADVEESSAGFLVRWDNGLTQITTSANSHWDGDKNTSTILVVDALSIAASKCDQYTTSGTVAGDWYLPAIDELSKMWQAKYEINKALNVDNTFTNNNYWSSSELNNSSAWFFNFINGNQSNINKISDFRVRAVRAF